MNYLQINYISFTSLYFTGLTLVFFVSQLIVASISVTSFFGTRVMAGLGRLSIEPYLLLSMLRGFGPGHYHFNMIVADSLSQVHSF